MKPYSESDSESSSENKPYTENYVYSSEEREAVLEILMHYICNDSSSGKGVDLNEGCIGVPNLLIDNDSLNSEARVQYDNFHPKVVEDKDKTDELNSEETKDDIQSL